ncbi:hypothetical protein [Nocardioides sp. SYSU DS0663]|uniref:hypothetical protein n=1 Tax=Nocardioides sp. SYSU DS0663 TaxID=3416445 RepID=UPI003F4BD4A6
MLALRRSLAAAFLAAAAGVAVPATPAVAAPGDCAVGTTQSHTRAAQAVFSGTVTDVERGPSVGSDVTYRHTVEVERVWKGGISVETAQVTTAGARAECGLGRLPEGSEVLFFVSRANGTWAASGDGGTAPASDRLVGQVTRLLGSGRSPVPPAPQTAQFTRVADGAPAAFTRTAAPGVAMVIVGLLGLLLVQRLGRR